MGPADFRLRTDDDNGVMEQNWIYHVMRAAFDFHRFSDRSD